MPKAVPLPVPTLGLLLLLAVGGCHGPDKANIELRKQNQQLQASVDDLKAQQVRDRAALHATEATRPTVPTLPAEQLDRLVTTHGIDLGRLTGGDSPDTVGGPDSALRVYVVPTDGQGDPIKAAGAITVEAFDLDVPSHPLLGTWHFPLEKTHDLFYSRLSLYTYVVECPWQAIPAHADLTVKVTFDDELTGRQFTKQTQVKVHPGPTTRP